MKTAYQKFKDDLNSKKWEKPYFLEGKSLKIKNGKERNKKLDEL